MLPDGSPNPDFVLNKPQYHGATVLVSGRNFGSGSSREHAPWALQQAGFRTVIAPSFGDIFRNNCYQNGLLPVVLPDTIVRQLPDRAENEPGYKVTIDLEQQTVADERDTLASFDIDPSVKHRLINGLDDIGLTLKHATDIDAFEAHRPGICRVRRSRSSHETPGTALVAAGGAVLWLKNRSASSDASWSEPATQPAAPIDPPKLGGEVDAELLAILACPLDKQPVKREGDYLVCQ